MTSLTIDIGNSLIKAGVFEDGNLLRVFRFEDLEGLWIYCQELPSETPIIISSVTNDELSPFYQYFSNLLILNNKTPLPVTNHYKTPETLGNDRLAAIVGAWAISPTTNNLVVDAGTCLKYDFIDMKGQYHGGSIAPGIEMKFKALHHYTQKLPLVEKNKTYDLTGDSTKNALISGVMQGTCFEIQGYIDAYSKINPDLQVIMTGGDHAFFADRLIGTIFAEPDLILKGLFEILKYNGSQV